MKRLTLAATRIGVQLKSNINNGKCFVNFKGGKIANCAGIKIPYQQFIIFFLKFEFRKSNFRPKQKIILINGGPDPLDSPDYITISIGFQYRV